MCIELSLCANHTILIYEYMDIDGQLFSMCYDTNINHGLHSTYSLHIDRQTHTNIHTRLNGVDKAKSLRRNPYGTVI